MTTVKKYGRIGMIARCQPVHLGHEAILRAMLRNSEKVVVGIGSANTYNFRCPFTLAETQKMLNLVLKKDPNCTVIPVPDLHDGPRWRRMVKSLFNELDCFVTANPYVANLMEKEYQIIHPVELLNEDEKIRINGEMVRKAMAKGNDWGGMLSAPIKEYIQDNQLDERFRSEFGLETLAIDTIIKP